MKPQSILAFFLGVLLALLLFSCMLPPAIGQEADTREPVVVLQTHESGLITASVVRLLPARPLPFQNYVCFREFGAVEIRCYAINPENLEVRFVDLTIVP